MTEAEIQAKFIGTWNIAIKGTVTHVYEGENVPVSGKFTMDVTSDGYATLSGTYTDDYGAPITFGDWTWSNLTISKEGNKCYVDFPYFGECELVRLDDNSFILRDQGSKPDEVEWNETITGTRVNK